jgi:O-antigen ligase
MSSAVGPKPVWLRQPASILAWPFVTLCSATVLGAMLGRGDGKVVVLPFVVLLLLFLASVPVAGYVAVLWSVGTVVDMIALPDVSASSVSFEPAEILLSIVLGSLMFLPRDLRSGLRSLARRRESVVLMIFLAAVLAGVATGISHGASATDAVFGMRTMLFYAAFWPAAVALSKARSLAFKLVAAGVVAVVILQLLQVMVGPSPRLFMIAPQDLGSVYEPEAGGFLRVRPPGLPTVYVVAAFALACALWGPARYRLRAWAMTAVTLAGLTVSLNRNMLLGLALGLAVAALVARHKHRFVAVVAGVAIAVAGVAVYAQNSSIGSNAIVARVASITNYSELKTQTLSDRYYENRIALRQIRSHPIAGLGWGPDYGAVVLTSDAGFLVTTPRSSMHEQYLWIWMRAGIIGLLLIIAVFATGIWNGARWFRARDRNDDAWLGAGIVASMVGIAASSNVTQLLVSPDAIVPFVGVLALAAGLRSQLAPASPAAG